MNTLSIVLQGDRFGWALSSQGHYREGGSERLHAEPGWMATWLKNMLLYFRVNAVAYSAADTPKCASMVDIIKSECDSRDIDIECIQINRKLRPEKFYPNAFIADELHGNALIVLHQANEAAK